MTGFSRLVRFTCEEDDGSYFADLGSSVVEPPSQGTKLEAYQTVDDLIQQKDVKVVTVLQLLAPLPVDGVPIYCVGLNYHSHAKEAGLTVPSYPPLWTKPAASLAHPGEAIPINDFCAKSLLDYEGELVFVTSKDCKDVSPQDAENYILGYTVGNDISCRKFQLPSNSGGQFFFAKAFDKFAPIGPTLISPELFANGSGCQVITKVNGQIRQTAGITKDMIFSPLKVLSHMSQGTTIPAGTAVMTGTAAGVGAFLKPKTFLRDGDVVEIQMEKVGILKNEISFKH
ncbi:fumarylacetoacetate hydrolase family protein [Pochonia chlamydosporia 170]|uniref:Fumarylacetoacetate hydrolase family protein n=1 Tax=Pochonia chlamydosporia 170 TaxID=1380566 RepID=A0A179FI58_METCM|nr:fumarylacetoacetate hydrolase family protein [Pochonia chlamydosporia 170]OAQ64693.2 fumarylacetoacetate hydrolase family protein [Pochonia chlamydosporia 170]